MVIIRVGLAAQAGQTTHVSLGNMSIMTDSNLRGGRRGMQVHITRLTESRLDCGQCSPMGVTSPLVHKSGLNEIKFDDGGEEV